MGMQTCISKTFNAQHSIKGAKWEGKNCEKIWNNSLEHPLLASSGEYDGFLADAFSLGVVVYV